MGDALQQVFTHVQRATAGWEKIISGREAYRTTLDQAIAARKTCCSMKAKWAKRLLSRHGIQAKLVRGYYHAPDGKWYLHVWLDIDGKQYDPTRSDFSITEDHSLACPDHHIVSWERIISEESGGDD